MNFWTALLLGAIQGLTEFLPISSSGHLVLAQKLLPSFSQPGVLFDVVIHLGTTFAVVLYFRKKITDILYKNWRYMWLIAVATVPAVIFGVFLGDKLEAMFGDIKAIAFQFFFTGIMCILTDKFTGSREEITTKDATLMGVAQALAIVPAISRSGATIFTGSLLKIKKEHLAEFSFLMSIPAILGANVYEIVKHGTSENIVWLNYVAGLITAFIFGYLSIKLVLASLHQKKFTYFGLYCLIVGVVVFFAF